MEKIRNLILQDNPKLKERTEEIRKLLDKRFKSETDRAELEEYVLLLMKEYYKEGNIISTKSHIKDNVIHIYEVLKVKGIVLEREHVMDLNNSQELNNYKNVYKEVLTYNHVYDQYKGPFEQAIIKAEEFMDTPEG